MQEQSGDSFLKLFGVCEWLTECVCVCVFACMEEGALWDCHFKKLHAEAGDFPLKLMEKKKTRMGSKRINTDRLMKLEQRPNLDQDRNVAAWPFR